ncbi:Protein Y71H2AM.4 [Aphelenchoides avenae]|nr:Protein Y71H2AM.4 [Aphelenchus avenae]
MTEATRASPEEFRRREERIKTYHRPRETKDPFTWTYPWKTAGAMFVGGAISAHLLNIYHRKPWYFDIAKRVPIVFAMGAVGYLVGMGREYHHRTRDAVIDHYMQLHPDDFENIKDYYGRSFGDIIVPWYPKRPQYRRSNLYVNEEDRIAVKPEKK